MNPPHPRRKLRGTRSIASAVSAVAVGVVGVMVGTALAGAALGVGDAGAWLSDAARDQGLGHDPDASRVAREQGGSREPLVGMQDKGVVSIRNDRTGEVITADMSRIRTAGARATASNSKVLLAKGMMVVVDGQTNSITRVDPAGGPDLGEAWRPPAGAAVADAEADAQGVVWVFSVDGMIRGLDWDAPDGRFVEKKVQKVERVSDDAVLAPHPTGVTIFGPRAGVIAQVGTGADGYQQSNHLIGIDAASITGSADLVPGALADQSAIVILDRGRVRQISTAPLGCARPAAPAVFDDTVYVVCQGNQKVIRLTRDGRIAGPEIRTPGQTDAQLTADGSRLVLNVHGADQGIEIDRRGAEKTFRREPVAGTQSIHVRPKDQDVSPVPAQPEPNPAARQTPGPTPSGPSGAPIPEGPTPRPSAPTTTVQPAPRPPAGTTKPTPPPPPHSSIKPRPSAAPTASGAPTRPGMSAPATPRAASSEAEQAQAESTQPAPTQGRSSAPRRDRSSPSPSRPNASDSVASSPSEASPKAGEASQREADTSP